MQFYQVMNSSKIYFKNSRQQQIKVFALNEMNLPTKVLVNKFIKNLLKFDTVTNNKRIHIVCVSKKPHTM